jgi:ribosomal protein S18 acetylase RimI-like enzyme
MDFGVIRKITSCDLNRIIELERKCFNEYVAYTPKQLKYLITMANSNCLAETIQETLRGFVIVLYKKGTVVAGIETLDVDPMFQGNGIGKKLLKAAEEDMYANGIKNIRLEVSVGNSSAIELYEKSGFRKIRILKNYYTYEQYGTYDAYRMIKELTT